MAHQHRVRRPGDRCVHCLVAEATTDDHGVPLSWYPEGSQDNVPRVKAPSCEPCNKRLKKVEDEIRLPIALSMNPGDPRSLGIPESAWRSIDPSAAKNEKDRRARKALRKKMQAALYIPKSREGEFPGFGPQGRSQSAIHFRAAAVRTFGEKLIRVCFWWAFGRYIGPEYLIETHVVTRGPEEQTVADLVRRGERIDVPPGVFLSVTHAADDPNAGLVAIDLWGQVRLYASIVPRDIRQYRRPQTAWGRVLRMLLCPCGWWAYLVGARTTFSEGKPPFGDRGEVPDRGGGE